MGIFTKVANRVLDNLKKQQISPTPTSYQKEFCKEIGKTNFRVNECVLFKELISQLAVDEQKYIKDNKIETIEEMIPLLLERINKSNVKNLANVVCDSLAPSISLTINENLSKFAISIGNSPDLIFEDEIQQQMKKFISQRINADQKIVHEKSQEITKLISLMNKYILDVIDSSQDSSKNVSQIKDEISKIIFKDLDIDKLSNLQTKLINAASSIEDEMSNVSTNLQTKQTEISKLQKEIEYLKDELSKAKKESQTDHLTKVLTRRAFDQEIINIEKNLNTLKDYALVFFDLDHFKNINDTYGHECGDVILQTFAKILLSKTDKKHKIARYGGEEFVAVIMFDQRRELVKYVQMIKRIINSNKFVYKDYKIKLTFSAGVVVRSDHDSYHDAILSVDELLYKAKANGRDMILFEDGMKL